MKRMRHTGFEEILRSWQQLSEAQCCESIVSMELLHVLEEEFEGDNNIALLLDNILCCHTEAGKRKVVRDQDQINEFFASVTRKQKRRLCGYTFKHGDIAFNCRTCQTDNTCVICLKCYQHSNHDGHEVYFHRTMPGGMCDCGDAEAWKPEGFCSEHGHTDENASTEETFPETVVQIGTTLVKQVIQLILRIFQQSQASFDEIKVLEMAPSVDPPPKKGYFLRVFNDDVHSDIELIELLQHHQIPNAAKLTRTIDSDGYGYVLKDVSFKATLALMKELQKVSFFSGIIRKDQYQHEEVVLACVRWLKNLGQKSQTFHRIITSILLDTNGPKPKVSTDEAMNTTLSDTVLGPAALEHTQTQDNELSFMTSCAFLTKSHLSQLIALDPYIRKNIALEVHDWYMTLMADKEFKNLLCKHYLSEYKSLMMKYLCGYGTEQESVFHVGVQLFTTPSIVKQYLESGLMDLLLDMMIFAFDMSLKPVSTSAQTTDFSSLSADTELDITHSVIRYRRYNFISRDLEYVLNIKSVPQRVGLNREWLSKLCRIYNYLQGMFSFKRIPETEAHISIESNNWIHALTLAYLMNTHHLLLIKGVLQDNHQYDVEMIHQLLNTLTSTLLTSCETKELAIQHQTLSLPLKSFTAPIYDVSSQRVSFHIPLHHLFATLCRFTLSNSSDQMDIYQQVISYFRNLSSQPTSHAYSALQIMIEYPLQVLVFSSQIEADLWVRNGAYTMASLFSNYNAPPHCYERRDLDYLLLQMGIVEMGPEAFLSYYLHKFRLHEWFFTLNKAGIMKTNLDKYLRLAEHCLLHLIRLVIERPSIPRLHYAYLRREILHQLAHKSCTENELLAHLKDITTSFYIDQSMMQHAQIQLLCLNDLDLLQRILAEIGQLNSTNAVASEAMGPKLWGLKEAFYDEYDPAFLHLDSKDHGDAQTKKQEYEKRQFARKLRHKNQPLPMVPPSPLTSHSYFQPITQLLFLPAMMDLMHHVLLATMNPKKDQTSETLFLRIIHLLTLQQHYLSMQQSHANSDSTTMDVDDDQIDITAYYQRLRGKIALTSLDKSINSHAHSMEHSMLSLIMELAKDRAQEVLSLSLFWLLQQWKKWDAACAAIIEESQLLQQEAKAPNNALERKKRQQMALEAMRKKQLAFAQSLNAMSEEEDFHDALEDMENVAEEEVEQLPICTICGVDSSVNSPLMYVGMVQRSNLPHHIYGEECQAFSCASSRSGASMHVQSCSHAIHLSCWDMYHAKLLLQTRLENEFGRTIGINPKMGEYLCPLCQSVSNCLIPYVPRSEQFVPASLEQVFASSKSYHGIYGWLEEHLAHSLQPLLDKGFSEDLKDSMNRFMATIVNVGAINPINEELASLPTIASSPHEKLHTLWDAITHTIRCREQTIMAKYVMTAQHAYLSTPTASKSSSTTAHASNGSSSCASFGLATRVGVNIDQQYPMEDMTINEEGRIHLLLSSMRLFRQSYHSAEQVEEAIVEPLLKLFHVKEGVHTWQEGIRSKSPLSFCQSLLTCDLLYMAVVMCSCLQHRADVIMLFRFLGSLHLVQAVVKTCTMDGTEDELMPDQENIENQQPGHVNASSEAAFMSMDQENVMMEDSEIHSPSTSVGEAEKAKDDETDEKMDALTASLTQLRQSMLTSLNIKLNATAPEGKQMTHVVMASLNVFLRQLIILLRCLFRGNDSESMNYVGFINSLHLSTDYHHLCEQLGIPTAVQLMECPSLHAEVLKFLSQSRVFPAKLPKSVQDAYVNGKIDSLSLVALITDANDSQSHQHAMEARYAYPEWLDHIPTTALPLQRVSLGGQKLFWLSTLQFYPLPPSYTDLHVLLAQDCCPNTGKPRDNPAICYLCGAILCAGTDCCRSIDRLGACTQHAQQCNYGTGAFFLLRKGLSLLIWGSRSCFYLSPYVDSFGEEDANLRRGRPLTLNRKRYGNVMYAMMQFSVMNDISSKRRTTEQYIKSNFF